jgi:flagella basal body P-ring formation protein FlgA
MKNKIAILFLFNFFVSFAQSETTYAVIPNKFSFLKHENPYNLSTNLKLYFEKLGYKAIVIGEEYPVGMNATSCNTIYPDLIENNGLMTTKISVVVKNCKGDVIAQSQEGASREKDLRTAYLQALRNATLAFTIPGNSAANQSVAVDPISSEEGQAVILAEAVSSELPLLYAQPIENGYQLVDATPKLVLKIFKTSQPDYFTAVSEAKNGVVFKKEGVWYFEYYENNVLKSEKITIKF